MRTIDRVNSPSDLKRLGLPQLKKLAAEIREEILATVSTNGGHLAPSLGVVELTLALHIVFNMPKDKIIWDVGHQCYAHKLVAGRRHVFSSLRRSEGISGFPKRGESPYDCFGTGHSSTSISAALGFALARDLRGEDYHVVAVIGDGALTGGMAFEAMNHAGHLGTRLIVILNDNQMSIAKNVGAIATYLSRLRSNPRYSKSKKSIRGFLARLGPVGDMIGRTLDRAKGSFKYLLVPGMYFEQLGFTYLGPIDGHDLVALQQVLNDAKRIDGPVLVHVVTRKGKGYLPAELDPNTFHGVGPFDIDSGRLISAPGPPTYSSVFGNALIEIARERPDVVAITAAMSDGTGLGDFAREFPERFFDVGIAEQHAVTLAAGLAACGMRPVVAIYSTFLQRAYDQLIHDVALQRLPVIFAVDRAGFVGEDGETHQGLFDLSYLGSIPNFTVMAPKDEAELCCMLVTALEIQGPVAIRYPRGRGMGTSMSHRLEPLPLGKAEVLLEGRDAAVFAVGPLAFTALEAAAMLRSEGIEISVVNPRFIKPIDEESLISMARRCRRILTAEENILHGGFGSAVSETLTRNRVSAVQLVTLGVTDEFVKQGNPDEQRSRYYLDASGIANAVRSLVKTTGYRSSQSDASMGRK